MRVEWRTYSEENKQKFFAEIIKRYPAVKDCPEIFLNCISWTVGNGWTPIVNKLLERLIELDPGVQIIQIKEKFGGLRVYCDNVADDREVRVAVLVSGFEALADRTCEHCGSTNDVERRGPTWLKTYCKNCHAKRDSGARMWDEYEQET